MATEIHILAHCRAKAGRELETRQLLESIIEPTCQEPGCIKYTLHVDRDRPTDFWFVETWADQAAVDTHMATDGTARLIAKLADLLAEPATLISMEKLA